MGEIASRVKGSLTTHIDMTGELRERRKEIPNEQENTLKYSEQLHAEKSHIKIISSGWIKLSFVIFLIAYYLTISQYLERTRITNSLRACSWDSWENWGPEQASNRPTRIVILADPQLVDDHTYPKLNILVQKMLRKLSDNYLHFNYKFLQTELDPDYTLFIGDLFDGGREWKDMAWVEEFQRFNRIFPHRHDRKSYRGLPGNHDIGFQNISVSTRERFAAHFGQSNDCYTLGNHTFLQLDTISYSHDDPEVHTEARDYVDFVKDNVDPDLPTILLTHVPLFRDPNVETCGPGRESSKPFPLMRGVQYQTVIDYWVTEKLISSFKPSIIFSGDDHDYCDMVHLNYSNPSQTLSREISCKSPSMTNGIKYPAYQLLSLNNPLDGTPVEKTYETKMCYLPKPYMNVKVYFYSYLVFCVSWWTLTFRLNAFFKYFNCSVKVQSKRTSLPPVIVFSVQCVCALMAIWQLFLHYNEM